MRGSKTGRGQEGQFALKKWGKDFAKNGSLSSHRPSIPRRVLGPRPEAPGEEVYSSVHSRSSLAALASPSGDFLPEKHFAARIILLFLILDVRTSTVTGGAVTQGALNNPPTHSRRCFMA